MMKFIQKIVNFFTKAKTKFDAFKEKAETFIELHRGNIKVMMNVFQAMYEKGNGTAKMQSVVQNVCTALGAEAIGAEYADDVVAYVEAKCQQIYDELVAEGGLNK